MRKISIICRLLGTHCRAFFALWLTFSIVTVSDHGFAQGIELPPPAPPAPPPSLPYEKDPAVIRKQKRDERKKIEVESETIALKTEEDKKRVEQAKAEAQKPRPFYGFIELSVLQPKAVVSDGRSQYVSDPTNHINFYVRTLWKSGVESMQPWIGLRIAPFGGYGTQDKLTARFAHTWMGPAFGFGRIATPVSDASDSWSRDGFLWSAGIAALSRLVDREESARPLPEDFRPTAWTYENPGLWSELRWIHITRGALGFGAIAGAQAGKGKIFYYAGGTISGFY